MNGRARRVGLQGVLYASVRLALTPVAWLLGLGVEALLSQAALVWLPSDYEAPRRRSTGVRYRPRRRLAAAAHV